MRREGNVGRESNGEVLWELESERKVVSSPVLPMVINRNGGKGPNQIRPQISIYQL